eukprot:m.307895 g.307895  ORF g.307895 m.307895 type:complete len:107 (-) comp27397_c1_seq1:120-440(-)
MYSVAIGVVVVVPSGAEPGLHLPLQEGKPIAPSAILAERHGDLPCRGESGVAVVLAVPVGVSDEGGDHIGGLVVDLQLQPRTSMVRLESAVSATPRPTLCLECSTT